MTPSDRKIRSAPSCLVGSVELAKALRLNEATVKNWTFGRPLTIKPCRVLGGSNVYSEVEIAKFYGAKQMADFGITPGKATQLIIDAIDESVVGEIGDKIIGMAVTRVTSAYKIQFYGEAPVLKSAETGAFVLDLRPVGKLIRQLAKGER